MARAAFWTTGDERTLRELYPTMTPVAEIAARMGRSQQSVRHHARMLGLVRPDPRAQDLRARLVSMVKVDDESGCWIWQGGVNKKGHPRLHLHGDGQKHPRVELLRLDGRWKPTTHCTRTTCDDLRCVAPDHARQLTAKQYLRERFAEGTLGHASHRAGIAASQRKRLSGVTLELVREIRQRHAGGESLDQLMQTWPQSRVSLTSVLRGERWREAGSSVFAWRPNA